MTGAVLGVVLALAVATAAGRAAGRRAVRDRLGAVRSRRRRRRLPPRVGVAVAAAVTGVVVAPVAGAAVVFAVVVPPMLRRRRAPVAQLSAAVATLPDAVDLLTVAARAGLPAPAAVAGIAERAPPPWSSALVAVVERTRRGERFGDAVDELALVGGPPAVGHPLRVLLRSAVEDGGDLVAGLERLAADARDLRRRRAEEAARRVPVRLLLPLVACSLPAFALLTIVPIVVSALEALDLST